MSGGAKSAPLYSDKGQDGYGRHGASGSAATSSTGVAAAAISPASARSTLSTPAPVAAETTSGVVPAARFRARFSAPTLSSAMASALERATTSGFSSRPLP